MVTSFANFLPLCGFMIFASCNYYDVNKGDEDKEVIKSFVTSTITSCIVDCKRHHTCETATVKKKGGDEYCFFMKKKEKSAKKKQTKTKEKDFETVISIQMPSTSGVSTKKPVDGGYGPYSDGACSASCGGGLKNKTRRCDTPLPANGGADCSGPSRVTESCNVQPCPERVSVLLVGGYNYFAEIATVVKTNTRNFTMTAREVDPIPQSAPKKGLSWHYMARIGTSQKLFLKVVDSSFIFSTKTLSWSSITNAQETPTAESIPALTFADGFLTFGGYNKDYADVKYFKDDFVATTLGSWPQEHYKPWYEHKVARVNETTFVLVAGRAAFSRWTMSNAIMGTLLGGDTLSWTPLQNLNTPRYAHCVTVLNQKVVVIGGVNGGSSLRSVEYLDLNEAPLTNQKWQIGPDLPYAINGLTCDVGGEEGTFAVIAGGSSTTYTVLVMSEDLKVQELPAKLIRARMYHSSVVLKNDEY